MQARVKDVQSQKKLFTVKRVVSIGGGIAVVLIIGIVLLVQSKQGAHAQGMSGNNPCQLKPSVKVPTIAKVHCACMMAQAHVAGGHREVMRGQSPQSVAC